MMPPKPLREIVGDYPCEIACGSADREITALCYDSRECSPGALFFCIRGFNVDGHAFVPEAVARFVRDGDYLASGGFGTNRIASALLHDVIPAPRA